MEMNQEVAELSSAPVDASLFEIPKDYAAVAADDMIREMVKVQSAAMAGAPKPAEPRPPQAEGLPHFIGSETTRWRPRG